MGQWQLIRQDNEQIPCANSKRYFKKISIGRLKC